MDAAAPVAAETAPIDFSLDSGSAAAFFCFVEVALPREARKAIEFSEKTGNRGRVPTVILPLNTPSGE